MNKIFFILPMIFFLSSCSYIHREQNQRLDGLDEKFSSLEEKVDALLVYNNKTYDIMVDNEMRLQELEKDAKKRGVPVPQKNISVAQLKQVPTPVLPAAPATQPAPAPQNTQDNSQTNTAANQVGVLSGQDLTKDSTTKDSTSGTITQNVVEPPKQTAPQEKPQQAQKQQKETTPPAQQKQVEQPAAAEKPVSSPVQTETAAQTPALPQASGQITAQAPQSTDTPALQNTQTAALSSNELYKKAYSLYQQREYAKAENLFDDFLAKYPQDVLAPNALYWKGETLYARAIYPQAIFAFKEVQTRYPKHPKTADSLLKTAMSYSRLGDKENASLHYLVLIEDWPNSTAAQKARALDQ